MQDIRNYITVFIIGMSMLIFFYILFLTKREIMLQRKFNSFALSTTKETHTLFDALATLLQKILKFFSKITKKIGLFNSLSKRYEKYVLLTSISSLDIVTLKNIFFFVCFITTFLLKYFKIINISYISLVIISVLAYLLPDLILNIKYKSKKKSLSLEVIDAIILIDNNLQKGLNIIDALDEVLIDIPDILGSIFKKVQFDLENGVDISLVFKRFADNLPLDSTSYINKTIKELSSLNLSVNETFAYLAWKLKEKRNAEEKLNIYLQGARLFFQTTIIIPIGVIILLAIFKPYYFEIVLKSLPALLLFISLILIYISYIILGRRLLAKGWKDE